MAQQTLEKRSVSASSPPRNLKDSSPSGVMIRFKCGSCDERLSVPEQFAGRKGKCPGCGQMNRVPTTAVDASHTAETLSPKKSPAPASIAPKEPFTWTLTPSPAAPLNEMGAPTDEVPSDPAQRYAMFTEVTERPERWTRGPLKLEEGETADHRGMLFFTPEAHADDDDYTLTREWSVDRRRTLPKPIKLALLGLAVLGIIGAIWGIFYLVLTLIIRINE